MILFFWHNKKFSCRYNSIVLRLCLSYADTYFSVLSFNSNIRNKFHLIRSIFSIIVCLSFVSFWIPIATFEGEMTTTRTARTTEEINHSHHYRTPSQSHFVHIRAFAWFFHACCLSLIVFFLTKTKSLSHIFTHLFSIFYPLHVESFLFLLIVSGAPIFSNAKCVIYAEWHTLSLSLSSVYYFSLTRTVQTRLRYRKWWIYMNIVWWDGSHNDWTSGLCIDTHIEFGLVEFMFVCVFVCEFK